MNEKKFYIPITKRDDDRREVAGYATTEALDSEGEIIDLAAVKAALPGYLGPYDHKRGMYQFGNIREMHSLSAVGKTMEASVDEKGLFVKAKVVDSDAWTKVKEGVYTGFSIGGRALKRMGNKIKELALKEISLVDRPANPETIFSLVKFDKEGKLEEVEGRTVNKIENPFWVKSYFDQMRRVV